MDKLRKLLFVALALLCLTPLMTPPIALVLGILVAQFIGNPFLKFTRKGTAKLLQFSVVGLGFGMNIQTAMEAGKQGLLFSVVSILGTLILGMILGKLFKIDRKISHLISCGTAICGGSAIAAISPIIDAEEKQISIALGTIFILNSVALFIFPIIGESLHLTDTQFGLWCAIAIHDTSSVVGAASKFGPHALEVATTVKLARALWIIPVALGTSVIFKSKAIKIKIPYFIGYFIIAMLLNTYITGIEIIAPTIVTLAKIGLTLTLFFIGAGLSTSVLKSVGIKPLFQGVILWIVISVATLLTIDFLV